MTIQDSIILGNDNATLSKAQIQDLPTVLDIVEYVSKFENKEALRTLDAVAEWLRMNRNGYYSWASDSLNAYNAKLMPLSQTPFLFMRGQSVYRNPCSPSLYRTKSVAQDEYETIQRIRIAEFLTVCDTHPVITELRTFCKIEDLAIAQHYGFLTECLDITNNKWVAVFFASTQYDEENDSYTPVETGYDNGYGVFYISKRDDVKILFDLVNKIDALGFQYFARPSSQNSWVYRMKRDENFNEISTFDKIFFRHDTEASKFIYEYSFRQQRFSPKDKLFEIAKEIRKPEYEFSNKAITRCKTLGVNKSEEEIKLILQKYHIGFSGNDDTLARFPKEVIDKEWKEWNEYGRENLKRHILPIPPIFPIL